MDGQSEAPTLEEALASSTVKCIEAPVRWLDSHHESLVSTILPSQPGYAYAPHDVGTEQKVRPVTLPAVTLHHFEQAIVSTRSSSVLLRDSLVLERVEGVDPAKCDFATGHLLAHDTSNAKICIQGAVIDIPRGIFLGGNGATNYYHLLVEILPRLQHVLSDPRFASYPLLVDQTVQQIPNYRQLLDIASGGHPFLALPGHRSFRVGSLAYVSTPNAVPFNLRDDVEPELEQTLTRPSTIEFLRDRFYRAVPESNAALPKRVFMARKPGLRDYNQGEIGVLFGQHGFVAVHMEDLTIAQQVQLMRNADIIAGPSGAAWANLAFCRKGAEAICWMADTHADCAVYSNLAAAAGVNLHYLRYVTGIACTKVLYQLNYRLDPSQVRSAIKQLWGLG